MSERPKAEAGHQTSIAADQLRLFIERIERLEEEKKGIGDDIKDVYAEAKGTGFDTKIMKKILALRKSEPHKAREEAALLETYCAALGMDDMFAGFDGRRLREAVDRLDADGNALTLATSDGEVIFENKAAAEKNADDTDLYAAACLLVAEHQKASASWLQRQLRIGYNSAAKLIERMEKESIVSPADAKGVRRVLCSPDELMLAGELTVLGVEPPLTRAAISKKLAERAVH